MKNDNTSDAVVMVVDDNETNLGLLANALKDDFKLQMVSNGKTALKLIDEKHPDLILLDIMMPEMDGYEVCRILKSTPVARDIPIIFLTSLTGEDAESKGLELGAADYVIKPFFPELLKRRIKNQIEQKRHRDQLRKAVKERTREVRCIQDVTIETMGTLAEYRDPETGGHIKRTQNYVRLLAQILSQTPKYKNILDEEQIEKIYKSSPLHDIGKIGVRDSILLKPGKLTPEEFEEMKNHTVYGWNAIRENEKKLGKISFLQTAKEIAYTHHEKWDGSGYPQGLCNEQIPLSGRLMALADVYDALISKRVYKPSFSHRKASDIILEQRGKHFDPDIVDAFAANNDAFRKVALEFADFKEEKFALAG